jgi:hypothetical protein
MSTGVFRSAKVLVQNTTDQAFTVAAISTLHGSWSAVLTPKQGDVLPATGSAEWMSESQVHGVGTSAFVRLSSKSGFSTFIWRVPWAGAPSAEFTLPHGLTAGVHIDTELPNAVVLFVVLSERRQRDAARE